MFAWLSSFFGKTVVNLSNIKNATVTNVFWFSQPSLKVSQIWLEQNLARHYTDEMAAKYVPELHQIHDFERRYLQDILDFNVWLGRGRGEIVKVREALNNFKERYNELSAITNNEQLNVIEPKHAFLTDAENLNKSLGQIYEALRVKENLFSLSSYKVLGHSGAFSSIQKPDFGNHSKDNISPAQIYKDKAPSDHFLITDLVSAYNRIFRAIDTFNSWLEFQDRQRNHKIIHGVAGTGKTHTSAYLAQKLQDRGDFVILLNAKKFNGDGVVFEERLNNLLDIPHGVRLETTLKALNKFAQKKEKRIFIIIDALNETTKESLGFSDIWTLNLQGFISSIRNYPYLYLICTLRTSYMTSIWEGTPAGSIQLTDIRRYKDVLEMCKLYFSYYNIEVTNLEEANLIYFAVPLLLDLYCKLVNEHRANTVTISLSSQSYMQVFEGYVEKLIDEVKLKRQLAARLPIEAGLKESSDRFMKTIEATLSVDDFVLSFDAPDTKSKDSLALPMLEGYLLFVRDKLSATKEIVKHTQQQIGGYLLAVRLAERFPNVADLNASKEFQEMLNGPDPALHHQLRLDILQFLLLLKPQLVDSLTEKQALQTGWWSVFNSEYDIPDSAQSLINNPASLSILPFVMDAGSRTALSPNRASNFNYIFSLLEKYDLWEFDLNWTYYLYNNAEELYDFINERLDRLKADNQSDGEALLALYVASIAATTVRELRDLCCLYLIEFGKRQPFELLSIAKRTASFKDVYVYERVIHAMYGVVLIMQHDTDFIGGILPEIAGTLFHLQFSRNAAHPLFNYIVIDSIKHILDVALLKQVWSAPEADLENIRLYRVPALPHWSEPSAEQSRAVDENDERNPPKPIGMDFAIYTIPRLLDNAKYDLRAPAVANVLKRVYEIGYVPDVPLPDANEQFKAFMFGHNVNHPGKVDRLSKKYNWKGFFDYAGVLLQRGMLDIYNIPGDPESGYQRLSDVGIDISIPNRDFKIPIRIYESNLIDEPGKPEKWTTEVKIDTIEQYNRRDFDGVAYVMLEGDVQHKVGSNFESRSFIMAETCFIEKNEDFEELKNTVCPEIFDWERDLQLSPSYSTSTYFGEYYFADNQLIADRELFSLKTGTKVEKTIRVRFQDILSGEFDKSDFNKEKIILTERFLHFYGEGTLIQYLNESDSEVFKGFSRNIPTVNMGKFLNLKADPASGQIFDSDFQQAMITVRYEDGDFENEFVYMRKDLLVRFMEAHNYALLYQNKQHSYAKNVGNNRFMKYAVFEG